MVSVLCLSDCFFFWNWFPGLAFGAVTFVNTYFMALAIVFIWHKSILLATIFLLFFWAIEGYTYQQCSWKFLMVGGFLLAYHSCWCLLCLVLWFYSKVQLWFVKQSFTEMGARIRTYPWHCLCSWDRPYLLKIGNRSPCNILSLWYTPPCIS